MKQSAGLLMVRRAADGRLQVLLAHPGGPWWRNKDDGAWTLPKGGGEEAETPLEAACREFREETGFEPHPPFVPLGEIVQRGGKHILAWAFAGDCDPGELRSADFEMEWPPRSGRLQRFPEVDRIGWFSLDEARGKINAGQVPLLDRIALAWDASVDPG
jgi:predicted NUDIX family NTP pyrophosphohydrolase